MAILVATASTSDTNAVASSPCLNPFNGSEILQELKRVEIRVNPKILWQNNQALRVEDRDDARFPNRSTKRVPTMAA